MAVNYLPKDLSALWLRSQVLIYHNSNQFEDCTIKKPDCFGNVLTSNFVITVASCFIELAKTDQCFDKKKGRKKKDTIFPSIKKEIGSIKDTIIVKVHILYLVALCISTLF